MGAIGMDVNAILVLTVNITANMETAFEDKAGFSFFMHFMSKDAAKKAGTNNQIVVHEKSPSNYIHRKSIVLKGSPYAYSIKSGAGNPHRTGTTHSFTYLAP